VTEEEFLKKVILNIAKQRSSDIDYRLKSAQKAIEEFYQDIPNIAKDTAYQKDIAALTNSIIEEENKRFFAELRKYLNEAAKNRRNSLIPVWIMIGLIFAAQLFLLFFR
jgi:hypothetical protein